MKKIIIVTALVAILALGIAGFAYAQTTTPPDANVPGAPVYGGRMAGRMGAQGGHGQGMMGGFAGQAVDGEYGPMHDAMISAMADALGLTPEELEARRSAGETVWQIAEAQGLTTDQFQELMLNARSNALSQAVESGLITQEQADWMNGRMSGMGAGVHDPANCTGEGAQGAYGRQGGGMRWNSQP